MRHLLYTALGITLGAMSAFHANAEPVAPNPRPEDDKAIISAVWENDKFANQDRNYTNGARVSWMSSEETTPRFVKDIAHTLLPFARGSNQRISAAFGQNMYTPTDLTQRGLIRNDRPYAGWTYGTLGIVSENGKVLDNVSLTLGVIGPLSGAEQTQKFIHSITDSQNPQGWHNQLKNEPGLILSAERQWRSWAEFSPFGLGVDFTPHAGFNLGNISTTANAGGIMRVGFDLPSDYGPPRIGSSQAGSEFFVPSENLGAYLFAGFDGKAVARDIFLDGNTFTDSHHVEKEIFVGSLQFGGVLTWGDTRLSYTHILMTDEFKTQRKPTQFGALTLSQRF